MLIHTLLSVVFDSVLLKTKIVIKNSYTSFSPSGMLFQDCPDPNPDSHKHFNTWRLLSTTTVGVKPCLRAPQWWS